MHVLMALPISVRMKMLTRKDVRLNLWSYKVCSEICFLPLSMNVNDGKIQLSISHRCLKIWKLFLWLSVVRELHYLWILAKMAAHAGSSELSDIAMVLVMGSFNANSFFVLYCLFLKSPEITETLFNMFFYDGINKLTYKLQTLAALCRAMQVQPVLLFRIFFIVFKGRKQLQWPI